MNTTNTTDKSLVPFFAITEAHELACGIEDVSKGLIDKIADGMLEEDVSEAKGILALISHVARSLTEFVEQVQANEFKRKGHHEQ